jgi:hypothetical protein
VCLHTLLVAHRADKNLITEESTTLLNSNKGSGGGSVTVLPDFLEYYLSLLLLLRKGWGVCLCGTAAANGPFVHPPDT